ncbi:hypothetical protein CFN16_16160 [Pseudomonas fluorescens]|uniref:Secreted protein n=1 Tax=Pseudomonas fluorescens TaxID=294 RepID=A0A345UYP8_PSEFL|nr:hypothetical protein [Pseudomonas fluorescens]AXJ05600.1 hypothetical protein CFN16_16160 [Pseudomonas fluorescens]WJK07690.1 hypothetical protein QR290_17880 [Pseudomonas fluorescens]
MTKLSKTSLTLGLLLAGGLALSNAASASEAFSVKQLDHGYSQSQAKADTTEKSSEGKCGEGKCGAGE